jgi:hypothetical protein
MSSIADPQPELPANEELVAYLDGELSPEECRRVEARLSTDAEYRRQFRDLDQAWEALNTLPASRVDDGFARTTIELATVDAQGELSQRSARAATETRRFYWSWAAAGLAAILASFAAGRLLLPNRNDRLLADLPVIIHADALSLVDSSEFLRQLAAKVPADQMTSDESKLDQNLAAFKSIASPSPVARRQWIENLTLEQKAELATQAKHFEQDFRPPEQLRMSALVNTLSDRQSDDSIQKTLLAYEQWLSELNPGDIEQLRADLRDLSPVEQADRVARAVRRQREQTSRHLTAEERRALRVAILELVEEKKPEYMRWMERRREGDRTRPMERLPHLILEYQLWNPGTREAARGRLVSVLSPDSQEHWRRLGRRPQDQAQQLRQWIREAFKPSWGPKELEDFFAGEEISNADRERLLNLPSAEMRAELEKMYLNHEWRGFADFMGASGMRPGGDRGGMRPDGPPPDRPPRPGGPPDELERGRFRSGPDDRRGPPDNLRERRPAPGGPRREEGPRGPPPDGPPPI